MVLIKIEFKTSVCSADKKNVSPWRSLSPLFFNEQGVVTGRNCERTRLKIDWLRIWSFPLAMAGKLLNQSISSLLGIRLTAGNVINVVDCIECYESIHLQPAAVSKIFLSISEDIPLHLALRAVGFKSTDHVILFLLLAFLLKLNLELNRRWRKYSFPTVSVQHRPNFFPRIAFPGKKNGITWSVFLKPTMHEAGWISGGLKSIVLISLCNV